MVLSTTDAHLFYSTFYALLNYVNTEKKILPVESLVTDPVTLAVSPEDARKVANVLWENPNDLIDGFLASAKDLTGEQREVCTAWKRHVRDQFILLRYLKKSAIFLHSTDDGPQAYHVIGLSTELEELFGETPPFAVRASLLPFKNTIVTDVFPLVEPFHFGGGMKEAFREDYSIARENKHVYKAL
ncbi:MAG: hypothetical protein IJ083_11970 [Clostridia bacterium]|nr:hypothetical protein [Clostridia bacterium]